MQESVALPEPVTLVGATEHEVLLVVKLTTAVKPLTPVTVIVDVPALPALTVTVVGLAVMVKSTTWKTMRVMCTRFVLTESLASKRTEVSPVPVLVHVRVTVWGEDPKVTGLGLEQVTLFGKLGDALKLTVPV